MRINELFEADSKHATFCFGRMNPPTVGHKQLLNTVKSVGGDHFIFVSQSQDPKKNPLDYSTKIKFMKLMFPEHAKNIVEDSNLNTVVKVASHVYNLGYRNATFVAGSDRLDAMKQLLTQYNGVEGKAHGYYQFEVLDFKSSGDREDGAEGVAGISASNARVAAANNNLEAFKESTGAGQYAEPLFKAVRQGMGIKETEPATESYGRTVVANKLKDIERAKKFASGELRIPTPQERRAQLDKQKEQEKKIKESMPGWDGEFSIGKYTYYTYDEREEDNRKTFHAVKSDDGKQFNVDWTPYDKMSPQDLKIWIKLGMPDRKSINSIGPLRHEDLVKYAQMKGIANLDPELAKAN